MRIFDVSCGASKKDNLFRRRASAWVSHFTMSLDKMRDFFVKNPLSNRAAYCVGRECMPGYKMALKWLVNHHFRHHRLRDFARS